MEVIRKFGLTFLLCIVYALDAAHIIFDLGGVLINPDKTAVAMKAGPIRLGLYALTHRQSPRTALYNILDSVEPDTTSIVKTYDENGEPLPGLMCDLLRGIPSKRILERIQEKITTNHALWPLATAIFEPKFMASAQLIVENGKKFVEECIEQGHNVYILSNWDSESFTYLCQQYPEFFGLFSGIVISGDCRLLKPDAHIYTHFLLEYELDPNKCFFIDNQIENVTAAANIGVSGTVVTTKRGAPDFDKVRADLTVWLRGKLP
jgi:FMN phosphatase YigB (HAD superfamily)